MNWDAVGAVGEILGAVAVVISLVYLASQIKLTRAQAKSDAEQAVLKEHKHTAEMSTRPEMARVLSKGVDSYETLDSVEQIQFNGFWVKYLYTFLSIRDVYLQGNIEEARYLTFEKDLVRCWLSPGMKQWWAIVRHTHIEVLPVMDELLENAGNETPYSDYMPGWKKDRPQSTC
jgi:hypothetical protein